MIEIINMKFVHSFNAAWSVEYIRMCVTAPLALAANHTHQNISTWQDDDVDCMVFVNYIKPSEYGLGRRSNRKEKDRETPDTRYQETSFKGIVTECVVDPLPMLGLCLQEDLPETVRQTKERMLRSLQQELTDKATEKRSKKVAKKYRMVKFFGEYNYYWTVYHMWSGTYCMLEFIIIIVISDYHILPQIRFPFFNSRHVPRLGIVSCTRPLATSTALGVLALLITSSLPI